VGAGGVGIGTPPASDEPGRIRRDGCARLFPEGGPSREGQHGQMAKRVGPLSARDQLVIDRQFRRAGIEGEDPGGERGGPDESVERSTGADRVASAEQTVSA
jgi:hypothetical protein